MLFWLTCVSFMAALLLLVDRVRLRELYPTYLYTALSSLIFDIVGTYYFWEFKGIPFPQLRVDLLDNLVTYPALAVFFIQYYDRKWAWYIKSIYISLFAGIVTVAELVFMRSGYIIHKGGWNPACSALLSIIGLFVIRAQYNWYSKAVVRN